MTDPRPLREDGEYLAAAAAHDDDYPETDDYGRRFRWIANYATGRYVREYEEEP